MIKKVRDFLCSLNDCSIDYCHWKSNEMLGAAVGGETDLDILCHRNDRRAFREVLNTNGFTRLNDLAFTGYSGIENYIAHDTETGKCIHVHLHFELTFGTPFLKEYVTPWAPYVLKRRVRNSEYNVPTTDPSTELFLLIVRYSLKIRRYNLIARRSYFQAFSDEYDWLAARSDKKEIETIANELLSPIASRRICELIENGPTIQSLIRISIPVQSELNAYSTYQLWAKTPIALARKGFRGIGKINRKFLNQPYPSRRKLPSRGIEVAIIGIDGSGKSTQLSFLHDWLSWKMDVHSVYLGSGDGSSSLLRYPLRKLNKLRAQFKNSGATNSKNRSKNQNKGSEQANRDGQLNEGTADTRVGLAKSVWAILLAREKQKKRRRATRARNRGMIVLMDRYPQNQFKDINDGPLLNGWIESNSKILKRIAAWEQDIYQDLENNSPDLVIKLITNPEVAKKRKPETPISDLQQKAEIIESLEYENSRVVNIDTHRDVEDVLNDIKKEIWDTI